MTYDPATMDVRKGQDTFFSSVPTNNRFRSPVDDIAKGKASSNYQYTKELEEINAQPWTGTEKVDAAIEARRDYAARNTAIEIGHVAVDYADSPEQHVDVRVS